MCALAIASVHASTVAVPATNIIRTPQFDSAIIKSDRLGGNFAYSTVEGHAYAAVSPVVQRITEPVGVSYTAHHYPLGFAHTPVAVSQPIYTTQTVSHAPVIAHQSILATPGLISHYPGLAHLPLGPAFAPALSPAVVQADPIAPAAPAGVAAPTPVEGVPVDADTVAVESA